MLRHRTAAVLLVLSGLAACHRAAVGSTAPDVAFVQATPAGPGLKALQVNGAVFNYVDSVQAPASASARPLVLVHGTIGYYGEWRRQVAAFSATRRTISYSRRYHLPNPRVEDGQRYTPQLHAADLIAFLRALKLGPVDLVGSSYGGAVVIEAARQHPELVHALILAEPAVNLYATAASEDSVRKIAAASLDAIDSARARFARGDSLGGMRAFMDGSLGPGAFDSAPAGARTYFLSQMFELRKEMLTPGDQWLPRMQCRDMAPLGMPVLVLIGGETLPIYHSMLGHLASCIPGARTATIPGVGHHLVENSPAFNAEVLRFLGSLPR